MSDADDSRGPSTDFLDFQLARHPELVRPVTAEEVAGLDDLLDGVEFDLDDALDDGFTLPWPCRRPCSPGYTRD